MELFRQAYKIKCTLNSRDQLQVQISCSSTFLELRNKEFRQSYSWGVDILHLLRSLFHSNLLLDSSAYFLLFAWKTLHPRNQPESYNFNLLFWGSMMHLWVCFRVLSPDGISLLNASILDKTQFMLYKLLLNQRIVFLYLLATAYVIYWWAFSNLHLVHTPKRSTCSHHPQKYSSSSLCVDGWTLSEFCVQF